MKTFKTPTVDCMDCFIDVNEIAAIVPYRVCGEPGSKILLKGGGEVIVYDVPKDVHYKIKGGT